MKEASKKGRERRRALDAGWKATSTYQYTALGAEMNQHYGIAKAAEAHAVSVAAVATDVESISAKSDTTGKKAAAQVAVYLDDETQTPPVNPRGDDDLYYHQHTYPGKRLPNARLTIAGKLGFVTSTQRISGGGRFTLITGPMGQEKWCRAAKAAEEWLAARRNTNGSAQMDEGEGSNGDSEGGSSGENVVEIKVISIGRGCDYEDTFFEWTERGGIEDDGCVLVRPDRFVAWRCIGGLHEGGDDGDVDEAGKAEGEKLAMVMERVLGFVDA